MVTRAIIGTPEYMGTPKAPETHTGINTENYDRWVAAYQDTYAESLRELKTRIQHVSYVNFQAALATTVTKFQASLPNQGRKFRCVAFVEPGKSQKWVTEIAITKGLKPSVYCCIGEEAASGLTFALSTVSPRDRRFHQCVIVDDGSYTGNQMANNVSAAYRILKAKFNVEPTFHLLIPYVTSIARVKILNLRTKGINVHLHSTVEMPVISDTISAKNIKRIGQVLWPHLLEAAQLERAKTTALYWFDHKVPNSMSFPAVITDGTVTKPKEEEQEAIPFVPTVLPSV